jgi:cation diffusion facilitator family transporter
MDPQTAPPPPDRFSRSFKSVSIGLVCNIFLAAVKIIAGILGESYALIADGIESLMDIFSSVIVLGGIKIGSMPADENHPYGHGKAEPLAAMIVSFALLIASIGIAIESIREILNPHHVPAAFTLIILIIVVLTKETLFRFIFSVGKDVNSVVVKTDAWHHRSDALTSLAAFIGISIALIGGKNYAAADDWAALVASAIIAFNGINLFKKAVAEVMDQAPDPQTEAAVRVIAAKVPKVVRIEKCRVRKSGVQLLVDIHVEVDGHMTVFESHEISHHVKDALMASSLNIADVIVHMEPATH